jgi:hypothetical protein
MFACPINLFLILSNRYFIKPEVGLIRRERALFGGALETVFARETAKRQNK